MRRVFDLIPSRSVRPLTTVNFVLRLGSLGGKLLLSLYMAQFLGLRDLGSYGLAFGCVMIAVAVFGLRLDYVLAREIAEFDIVKSPIAFQSASLFYLSTFVLCSLPVLLLLHSPHFGLDWSDELLIYALCCFEAYANLMYEVMISLNRSMLANVLIFIRGGLWTIAAIALSWIFPQLRNAEFVLQCWFVGLAVSVSISIWCVRSTLLPPRMGLGSLRTWLRGALRQVFMIWLGSVAVTVGAYLDRFVLAQSLSLEQVGVATFYLSFTSAVLSLIQSSTLAARFPELIAFYKQGRFSEYIGLFKHLSLLAAMMSACVLIALGIAVPLFANLTHKTALTSNILAFVLLLSATWIKTHAESAYYMLYVERKNDAVWTGNIMYLLTSASLNFVLIPRYGINGLGAAAVASATALLAWRLWLALKDKGGLARLAL